MVGTVPGNADAVEPFLMVQTPCQVGRNGCEGQQYGEQYQNGLPVHLARDAADFPASYPEDPSPVHLSIIERKMSSRDCSIVRMSATLPPRDSASLLTASTPSMSSTTST